MIYNGKEIDKLSDEELTAAIAKLALQLESWEARRKEATPAKAAILPENPGKAFMATKEALDAEKAKRGI